MSKTRDELAADLRREKERVDDAAAIAASTARMLAFADAVTIAVQFGAGDGLVSVTLTFPASGVGDARKAHVLASLLREAMGAAP